MSTTIYLCVFETGVDPLVMFHEHDRNKDCTSALLLTPNTNTQYP